MPITNMFWRAERNRDIHVLRGQVSPTLSAVALVFAHGTNHEDSAADYMAAHPGDVTLVFRPLFRGVQNGDLFEGHGLHFDTTTGELDVDGNAPPIPKNNFIVEVVATNSTGGAPPFTELIRFHVHGSVTRLWLTPSRITIRPVEDPLVPDPPYRFAARAEFDDGTVGDVTLHHGVTWAPVFNFPNADNGLFVRGPLDDPGHDVTVTATLPTPAGPQVATATIHVANRWSDEQNVPPVSIVPGGGWPGTLKPELAPNVLFLGDGFPQGDSTSFENITNSLVRFMKSDALMRPFDVLATSINFWRAFVPAPFGISVRSEVYTRLVKGKTVAKPLPEATRPVANEKWTRSNMVYAIGLPVPADAAKDNQTLRTEWAALLDPDPAPNLNNKLIDGWKRLSTRTFIDEVDAFPAMSYGVPPAANEDSGYLLGLHEDRGEVAGLKLFYPRLSSDNQVQLDGGRPIGNIWASTEDGFRFDNTDLVVLLSSIPGGRALNGTGYIALSTHSGNIDLPVTRDPNRNAVTLDPPAPADAGPDTVALKIPNQASADSCRTMAHELAHSFGVGDEYEDVAGPFQDQNETFDDSANLTTRLHAQVNGAFDGDEIRWNWHRITKAAVLDGADPAHTPIIEPSPGVFKIPLRLGEGLQFKKGETVILRLRPRLLPLGKASDVLTDILQLEVGIAPEANAILAIAPPGPALTLADFADFVPGSILYAPTRAPASAVGTTPFAEMIPLNVKNEITAHNRPLTAVPCPNRLGPKVQQPNLANIDIKICFSHKTSIVGLYEGGNLFACGVFHPTGNCMMRHDHDSSAQFCAVCRYIIVDFVNPFHHFTIDRDYGKIYPQPD